MINLNTYAVPRPFNGYNIPISIQNTALRDYAKRNKMQFLLSITELSKKNSYLMLSNLLDNKSLKNLGVVSGFVFPIHNKKLLTDLFIKKKLLKSLRIHLVLESLILSPEELVDWANDIYANNKIIMNYNDFINKTL